MSRIALALILVFVICGAIFGTTMQKPAVRPPVESKDIDFGPYMSDLQRRIKKVWFPPKGKDSSKVVVVFKVHHDGKMTDLRATKSSGLAFADQAALNAVHNAAPFGALPAGSPENVDIQFTFDYNVFKGKGSGGVFRRF